MGDHDELPVLDPLSADTSELLGHNQLPDLPGGQAPMAMAWQPERARADYGIEREILRSLLSLALGSEPGQLPPEWSPEELESAGGYGESPDSLPAAVLYAVRVYRRKALVANALTQANTELQAATAKAKAGLKVLGEHCYARRGQAELADLAELFAKVDDAAHTTADRDDVLAVVEEQNAIELQEKEAVVAAATSDAEPDRMAERVAVDALAQHAEHLKRAEAMLKRADIELRAARNASAVSPERLEELSLARAARERGRTEQEARYSERAEALQGARQRLLVKQAVIDAAIAARDALLRAQAATRSEFDASVAAAHGQRADALCAVASQAMQRGLVTREEAAGTIEELNALRKQAQRVALTEVAIGAYDEDAVKRGMITAAAAGMTLIALLAWLVA